MKKTIAFPILTEPNGLGSQKKHTMLGLAKRWLPLLLFLFTLSTLSAQKEESPPCGCTSGAAQIGSGVGVPTIQSAISLGLIASAANSPFTPQVVCIKGTLLAQNINYTFNASVLTMDANAAIKVNSNGTLTFDNTTIQGCTNMWQHVEVSGSGRLKSFSSTIVDGIHAFRVLPGAHIIVKDNQFINNYIGVYLLDHSPSAIGLVFLDDVFAGNGFATSTTLLKSPYQGQLGFAGIQISGISGFTVGTLNSAGTPNNFRNLVNGIVAYSTRLAVNGANFSNIKQMESSSGIRLDGRCGGVFTKNTFTDCNYGLNSQSSFRINFSENTLIDIRRIGVDIKSSGLGNSTGNINISLNNISTLSNGVHTTGINIFSVANLAILNNVISVGSETGTLEEEDGIFLQGSFFSASKPGVVSGNTISAYSGADGIHWGDGSNTVTEHNNITLKGPVAGSPSGFGFATGIIQGAQDNAITRWNTILGYGTDNFTDGIGTTFGNTMTFCCNSTNLTNRGFNYFGTGTLWRISQTSFGSHSIGLFVQGNSSFTEQNNQGNLWLGTYGVAGARHTGNLATINTSRFSVNPFALPFKPLVVSTPNAPNASWFIQGAGTALTCGSEPECGTPSGQANMIDDMDIIIAQGQFQTGTPQEPVMRWVAERGLYARLQSNSSLLSLNASLNPFYNANQATKVGLYQNVENGIAALANVSPVELAQFKANSDLISAYLDDLNQKDYQMVGASPAQLAALALDKATLTNSIYQLELANEALNITIQGARNAQALLVQAQNATLVASTVWEQNEKTVNEVYLSWVLTNDLTAAQLAQLLAIASQCPLEGGRSVFGARALYSMKVSANFEDGILCDAVESREAAPAVVETTTNPSFNLQPNPAKEEVTLVFGKSGQTQFPDKITIFNMIGQPIAEFAIEGETESINLPIHQIPVGIYLVKASAGNATIGVKKLVIAR